MSKRFDLTGKVAIVTGSSRGIGEAIARQLAEAGAKVVVSSRKQPACDAVARSINEVHGEVRAVALAASISSKEQLQALVQQTVETCGRLDVVVCNAATNPYYGPMEGITDEQFQKTLTSNIISCHWLISLARPEMIRQGGGSAIIVSSTGGLRGSAVLGAYNVSKAADMQLARDLAVELGPHKIRVNCIAPGLVKTAFARALWEVPEMLAHQTKITPLGRIAEPDDIAGGAVFLASEAGAFITGQTLVIDGGATVSE